MKPSILGPADESERQKDYGSAYEFTFWDFTLLPLLMVLAVMTLSILWRKRRSSSGLDTAVLQHEKLTEGPNENCKNKGCIRCLNKTYAKDTLLEKLQSFKSGICKSNKSENTELSRLERAVCSFRSLGQSVDELNVRLSQPTVFSIKDLGSGPWYSPSIYGRELNVLLERDNFDDLLNEFSGICDNCDLWTINKTDSGCWKTFYFINQGKLREQNCDLCPKTVSLIMGLPCLLKNCTFGNALFSVIYPGCKIKPHTGASNARLRCHITLASNDNCYIVVGGERRRWTVGKMLLFDDSFPHEVVYNGNEGYRAVLLIDIWHPFLTQTEKDVIQQLFPASV